MNNCDLTLPKPAKFILFLWSKPVFASILSDLSSPSGLLKAHFYSTVTTQGHGECKNQLFARGNNTVEVVVLIVVSRIQKVNRYYT